MTARILVFAGELDWRESCGFVNCDEFGRGDFARGRFSLGRALGLVDTMTPFRDSSCESPSLGGTFVGVSVR